MNGSKIPQAQHLDSVRSVIEEIGKGTETAKRVATVTGISPRHVGYALRAAELLGFLDKKLDAWGITPAGKRLLATARGTPEEATAFREAIDSSAVVAKIAPGLLSASPPAKEAIVSRIHALTRLAPATSTRRAEVLLSWRRQLLGGGDAQVSLNFPAATGAPAENLGGPARRVARRAGRPAAASAGARRRAAPRKGMMLGAIQVENYGPIRSLSVKLSPFMVMIGRNATGKSTFMDTLGFVADCLELGVVEAIRRRATTLSELFWCGEGSAFSFAFDLDLPADAPPRDDGLDVARYEVSFGVQTEGLPGVLFERLYLRPRDGKLTTVLHENTPPTWRRVLSLSDKGTAWYGGERSTQTWKTVFNLGTQKLALSNLPEDLDRLPVANRVRKFFMQGIQRLALNPTVMTRPCSPLVGRKFQVDGSNLPMVVKDLLERDPARFESWSDHLREALPEVQRVRVVEREEDRHLYLKLTYHGGLELPAWRLSEGTLRILALTLIPFAARPDAIFLIEEPENGVHPQAVEAIHQAFTLTRDDHVIIASHSPVFVGIVEPEDLLCFTTENGATRVIPGAEHPVLQTWQRDVDLGTLFAARVLE